LAEPDKGPPITGQQRAGGKKYRLCTECGKSVQNLAKHLKMHRGVKPDRWFFYFIYLGLFLVLSLTNVDTKFYGTKAVLWNGIV
jgi:hypothetical protein